MNNDEKSGQKNPEEVETGEIDRREERQRELEDEERRADQGSQQPGGDKKARPWENPRGPSSGKKY